MAKTNELLAGSERGVLPQDIGKATGKSPAAITRKADQSIRAARRNQAMAVTGGAIGALTLVTVLGAVGYFAINGQLAFKSFDDVLAVVKQASPEVLGALPLVGMALERHGAAETARQEALEEVEAKLDLLVGDSQVAAAWTGRKDLEATLKKSLLEALGSRIPGFGVEEGEIFDTVEAAVSKLPKPTAATRRQSVA